MTFWRKSILGQGNSKCKHLEEGKTLEYSKNSKGGQGGWSIISSENGTRWGWRRTQELDCVGLEGQVRSLNFILRVKGHRQRVFFPSTFSYLYYKILKLTKKCRETIVKTKTKTDKS